MQWCYWGSCWTHLETTHKVFDHLLVLTSHWSSNYWCTSTRRRWALLPLIASLKALPCTCKLSQSHCKHCRGSPPLSPHPSCFTDPLHLPQLRWFLSLLEYGSWMRGQSWAWSIPTRFPVSSYCPSASSGWLSWSTKWFEWPLGSLGTRAYLDLLLMLYFHPACLRCLKLPSLIVDWTCE